MLSLEHGVQMGADGGLDQPEDFGWRDAIRHHFGAELHEYPYDRPFPLRSKASHLIRCDEDRVAGAVNLGLELIRYVRHHLLGVISLILHLHRPRDHLQSLGSGLREFGPWAGASPAASSLASTWRYSSSSASASVGASAMMTWCGCIA